MGIWREKFDTVAKLFALFVEQGYLCEQTTLYYQTMLGLKERLIGENSKVDPVHLINLTWSLIALEGTQSGNPIMPKLLEALSNFEREEPITQQELIKLHQIDVYIDEMVKQGKLPR